MFVIHGMLEFFKMHGAGNDFIVADDRALEWPRLHETIKKMCDRRRGIGADGLILISASRSSAAHLKMTYFNNDGHEAEMCGNGLRCAALFAFRHLGSPEEIVFETGAGILRTKVLDETLLEIEIPVKKPPEKVTVNGNEAFFVNTGVPHLVLPCPDVLLSDIEKTGCEFRNHPMFQPEGTNVNFIEIPSAPDSPVPVRTYERGVEAETAACGTGIVAAAISLAYFYKMTPPITFVTRDSDTMSVDFYFNDNMVAPCGANRYDTFDFCINL